MVEIPISCLHTCIQVIKETFVGIFIEFVHIEIVRNTLKKYSRGHHFASIFQNFFRGKPPDPPIGGRHPLLYPPPLIPSGLSGVPPPGAGLLDPPLLKRLD
jgi:hypothetical protein